MATKKEQSLEIVRPRWKMMEVTIKGIAPLAMQNRPQVVVENLSRKDNGLPQIKYKSTDWRKFLDSIHWIDENKKPNTLDDNITEEEYESQFHRLLEESKVSGEPLFYIPTEAFKESICKGAKRDGLIGNKEMPRGWFIILGDKAPITYSGIEMEKNPTINKNGMSKAMVVSVYSKFYDWSTKLKIHYNENLVSEDNLVNMIISSGMSVGVLARRTELSFGKYGTFTVTDVSRFKTNID